MDLVFYNLLHVLTLLMCYEADAHYQKKRTRTYQDVVSVRMAMFSRDSYKKFIFWINVSLLI